MMMKREICASCSENLRSRIGNDEKGDCVLRNIGSVCGSEGASPGKGSPKSYNSQEAESL
jgi:hypothetical protein